MLLFLVALTSVVSVLSFIYFPPQNIMDDIVEDASKVRIDAWHRHVEDASKVRIDAWHHHVEDASKVRFDGQRNVQLLYNGYDIGVDE